MSLDKVKATVLDEAKARAQKMLDEAKVKVECMLADSRTAEERRAAELVHETRLRVERETVRELEGIRYDSRLQILAAKNEAIDEVFKRSRDRIAGMADADYLDMIGKWLAALPADVGGVLKVNPKDEGKFASGLEGLNRGRSGSGVFTGVQADAKVANGVVVEGADYSVDCTVERRLGELRESLAGDLARVLFGA